MILRRGCLCGHMWAVHNHYGGSGGCVFCPCDWYQPTRRRRWWTVRGSHP